MRTISTAGDRNADWIKLGNPAAIAVDRESYSIIPESESRIERISRLLSNTGKKCGDGFIEEGDTCHIGETAPEKIKEVANWVFGYSWLNTTKTMPSPGAQKFLKQFVPDKPVTLYRFEQENHDPSKAAMKSLPVQSWSHDKEMVQGVVDSNNDSINDEIDEEANSRLVMREKTFSPSEIFTDFTRFPKDLKNQIDKLGGDSEMSEVLVYKNKIDAKPDKASTEESPAQKEKRKATENGVDLEIAGYLYKVAESMDADSPQDVIDALEDKIKGSSNNATGWKSRVQIYKWFGNNQDAVQKEIENQSWPKHGPMAEVIDGFQNGYGHEFIKVGKYFVDPLLRSKGLSHDDITKFDQKLADAYEFAGEKAQRITAPTEGKKKASTADILGYSHQLKLGDKPTYTPSGPWQSAGAVVFRYDGKISIRKVKGGFGGYDWSLAKGRVDKGETDEIAAHREVLEESGHKGTIVGDLGQHKGTSSTTHFYLMKHESDDTSKMDGETEKVEWVTPLEAADRLDSVRDLRVLVRAMEAMKSHLKS